MQKSWSTTLDNVSPAELVTVEGSIAQAEIAIRDNQHRIG